MIIVAIEEVTEMLGHIKAMPDWKLVVGRL
jgi:hypothetical protein